MCIGGNQRDVDRQRSKKRAEKSGPNKKKNKDGGNASQALTNKKEHDAEIMRLKQVQAGEKKPEAKLPKVTNGDKKK